MIRTVCRPHPTFFIKIIFFNKKVTTDVISVITFLIKNIFLIKDNGQETVDLSGHFFNKK
jgi:hypothetical protein